MVWRMPGTIEVIDILQVEDSISKSLQNLDSTKSAYYVILDKKKSGLKGGKMKMMGLLWILVRILILQMDQGLLLLYKILL